MKYIKHYYVDASSGKFITSHTSMENVSEVRHPIIEYPNLDVKIWTQDSDGIDICISEISDDVSVTSILNSETNKYAVKVLTEDEYNYIISLEEELRIIGLIDTNDPTIKETIKGKWKSFKEFIDS